MFYGTGGTTSKTEWTIGNHNPRPDSHFFDNFDGTENLCLHISNKLHHHGKRGWAIG